MDMFSVFSCLKSGISTNFTFCIFCRIIDVVRGALRTNVQCPICLGTFVVSLPRHSVNYLLLSIFC